MISIGRNLNALSVLRRLSESSADLSRSFERLSSGQRINRASDDAAGLAVATSLSMNGRVFAQGVRNLNDGISLLNQAQGSLSELNGIGARLKELAEQAANGTLSLSQRRSLDQDADALVQEFNRITSSTKFNGVSILDANFSALRIQSEFGVSGGIEFNTTGAFKHSVTSTYGGTLSSSTISIGTGNKSGPETADFNGDGKADIVTIGSAAGLRVELGNGDGTFQAVQSYAAASAGGLVIGDFNGDGAKDIFVKTSAGANQLFLNDGSGSFTQSSSFTTTNIVGLQSADFNGDGRDDLIYTDGTSTLSVRFANSDGSFQTAVTSTATGTLQDLRVGDFNQDGIPDAIAAQKASTSIYLLTGASNGSLTQQTSFNAGVGSLSTIEIGDLNDDGLLDLVANGASGVGVLLASSTYSFSAVSIFDTVSTRLALADLDQDGFIDIITTDGASNTIYKNNGSGGFSSTFDLGDYEGGGSFADFDGNGSLDFIAGKSGDANLYLVTVQAQETTSIAELNLNRRDGALSALGAISAIQARLSLQLGQIGAAQSRLGSALGALTAKLDEYKSAESRITDIDIAEESSRSARLQILRDAGAAVLAQANQSPNLVLGLLKA